MVTLKKEGGGGGRKELVLDCDWWNIKWNMQSGKEVFIWREEIPNEAIIERDGKQKPVIGVASSTIPITLSKQRSQRELYQFI